MFFYPFSTSRSPKVENPTSEIESSCFSSFLCPMNNSQGHSGVTISCSVHRILLSRINTPNVRHPRLSEFQNNFQKSRILPCPGKTHTYFRNTGLCFAAFLMLLATGLDICLTTSEKSLANGNAPATIFTSGQVTAPWSLVVKTKANPSCTQDPKGHDFVVQYRQPFVTRINSKRRELARATYDQ